MDVALRLSSRMRCNLLSGLHRQAISSDHIDPQLGAQLCVLGHVRAADGLETCQLKAQRGYAFNRVGEKFVDELRADLGR